MTHTRPAALALDLTALSLNGAAVATDHKRLGDVAAIFADTSGVDPATVLYDVDVYHRGDAESPGNLYVGMTTVHPFTVNGEYAMTRGHFHADRRACEIYAGVAGEGLLLLMDEDGRTRVEEVRQGSIHHILGTEAHRLVNTGAEPLKVFAVWPTTAGYDYAALENAGFGVRVFAERGLVAVH